MYLKNYLTYFNLFSTTIESTFTVVYFEWLNTEILRVTVIFDFFAAEIHQ